MGIINFVPVLHMCSMSPEDEDSVGEIRGGIMMT